MKPAKLPAPQPTIRFSAKLEEALLTLPKSASAKLPARGMTMVEATINGFPFRAALEPDGKGSHCLRVNQVMHDAAGATAGETVTVEITRAGDEPATRMPADLRAALAAAPRAQAMWAEITPNARQNWILWLSSGKLAETRLIRIKTACSMLGAGKKRVCCFGGLSWLRKDHKTAGENWLQLPKAGQKSQA
ncbi:MAG TPA: YdeI/OmpD-associated family protein [Lacunisphaera sp.]|nr:YdeI/OmpD-associated family protein [Lacunisphaera sp.]